MVSRPPVSAVYTRRIIHNNITHVHYRSRRGAAPARPVRRRFRPEESDRKETDSARPYTDHKTSLYIYTSHHPTPPYITRYAFVIIPSSCGVIYVYIHRRTRVYTDPGRSSDTTRGTSYTRQHPQYNIITSGVPQGRLAHLSCFVSFRFFFFFFFCNIRLSDLSVRPSLRFLRGFRPIQTLIVVPGLISAAIPTCTNETNRPRSMTINRIRVPPPPPPFSLCHCCY